MLRLDKVIKPWKGSAALSDRINLYGFWNKTTFLTLGSRFLPKQVCQPRQKAPANFFRAPPRKQTSGIWEPGALVWLSPV